jgi:hypothetical protein
VSLLGLRLAERGASISQIEDVRTGDSLSCTRFDQFGRSVLAMKPSYKGRPAALPGITCSSLPAADTRQAQAGKYSDLFTERKFPSTMQAQSSGGGLWRLFLNDPRRGCQPF